MIQKVIPIMHCFDNNYVIPAAVCFLSMLENADKINEYHLYVLHTDISPENQDKLSQIIKPFSNAQLFFINMENKFDDLFEKTQTKGHYSKEMYYKFLAPSLFCQYDTMIITDVDVVFLGDISKQFFKFQNEADNYYLAGVKMPCLANSWLMNFHHIYDKDFSQDEKEKLLTGGGYWIFNLKKMREDNCEEKFISYAIQNANRLLQPEQDSVNLVCYPKIKLLPLNSMVCSYLYDLYLTDADRKNDLNYSYFDISSALDNPIQLHYATSIKPWNTPSCTKSQHWFSYLLKTPFFYDVMKYFDKDKNEKQKYYWHKIHLATAYKKKNTLKILGFLTLKQKDKK